MDAIYHLSVYGVLESAANIAPNKTAIVDEQRRVTYRELLEEASSLALGISSLGINKGDRVAVCLPNWYETIVLYFAIGKIGAIVVPFNTSLLTTEAQHILEDSSAKALFSPEKISGKRGYEPYTKWEQLSSLHYIIYVRNNAERAVTYRKLLERGSSLKHRYKGPKILPKKDIYAILYTSGTTGKPKGVMLTHKNIIENAVIAGQWMKCTNQDVFLLPTPLFHIMSINFLFRSIIFKGKLVLMEIFKPQKALSLIEEERVTVHPGVPAMFLLELNHPSFQQYDISSLRTGEIAGAPCPIEIVHRVRTEMDCDILVAYGLTETAPVLTITGFDDNETVRAETVGRPLPGVEVKIVDEKGEKLEVGETGELAIRSFSLMKGYYGMPEKTSEVIDEEGWFYTGDLAVMDEDSNIRITGRKNDIIIRGEHRINPYEVEKVFYTHPNVLEAVVVGIPEPVLGEISCACLRLRSRNQHSEKDMEAFIRNKVANHMRPDRIVFMESFPITHNGKIRKMDLQFQLKNVII